MTKYEALKILRLSEENPSNEDIITAYKREAMRRHPDRGGSVEAFAELRAARSFLYRPVCATCDGTGYVAVYNGPIKDVKECPECWKKS